jgi:hypothetical protein
MTNKNDERILEMRKQIAEKKEKIGKLKRFIPITNCILPLKEQVSNINVLSKRDLIEHLVILNVYKKSAEELGVLNDLNYNGYNIIDWIDDINNKLEVLFNKEEENKLKAMESKLEKLLSEEKKTELEIDEIADLLK